ncbi:MAG: hypothetical protein Ct9H300mP1_22200 [Planctomycetaceae bacterium]|nr:MAG: hypothetical protein Ct9H300mP1_22200 [Planctomycetaceae bacterium]
MCESGFVGPLPAVDWPASGEPEPRPGECVGGGGRRGGVADQALRSPANHLPGKSWGGPAEPRGREPELEPSEPRGGNRVRLPGRLNWSLSDFWDGLRLCDNGGDFGRCRLSGSRCRLGCRPAAIHILPCLVVPPTRNRRPTRGRLISSGQRESDRGEHKGGNCHDCGGAPMVILLVKFVLAGIPLAPWSCLAVAGLCESNPGDPPFRLTHLRAEPPDVMEDRPFSGIGFGL